MPPMPNAGDRVRRQAGHRPVPVGQGAGEQLRRQLRPGDRDQCAGPAQIRRELAEERLSTDDKIRRA